VHYNQYTIELVFVTPRGDESWIVKFIVKEKLKPEEILHRLNDTVWERDPIPCKFL
jgi:hypothetical protein